MPALQRPSRSVGPRVSGGALPLIVGGSVSLLGSTAVIATASASWWPNLTLLTATLLLGGTVWLITRRPAGSRSILVVLTFAALCQLPGLTLAPITSTDAYRYVWDGRVQLSGSSPYSHVPLDDALANLRDPILFPGLSPADRSGVTGPPRVPRDPAELAALSADDPRTRINRPQVPTIYPPVAQAYFTAVAFLTPWSDGTFGLQLAAAAIAVGLTALLATELRRRNRDPRWAILWGWSPIVALEAGSAAHIDVLAAALIVAAVITATRRAPVITGLLLGAAAAVKLLPLLVLPAFTAVRRDGLKTPLVAIGTFAASYLPHVLAVGTLVLGFLPGYLGQEGFSDGSSRSAILALVLPPEAPANGRRPPRRRPRLTGNPPARTAADRSHLLLAVRRRAPADHTHLPLVRRPAHRPRRTRRAGRVARRTARFLPGLREFRARGPPGPDPPHRSTPRTHHPLAPPTAEA